MMISPDKNNRNHNSSSTIEPQKTLPHNINGVFYDDDDDWEVSPENLAKLAERYKGQEYPLLMDELPLDWDTNPHYQALQTILYSEQTAAERAESLREQGNEYFVDVLKSKKKKSRYIDAIKCYSEGLNQKCEDQKLNSLLYSNRAHVRLLLGHFINCIDDSRKAIECDAKNIKAYFRAAKASFYMQLWKQCLWFCNEGLKIDPENRPILDLRRQGEKQLEEYREKKEDDEKKRRPIIMKQKQKKIEELEEAYKIRKIEVLQTTDYDTTALQVEERHYYDRVNDILHWPCLCLYPVPQISEMILDFEDTTTLLEHLKIMFPGDSFLNWDIDHTHRYDNLCVYYEGGFSDGSVCRIPTDIPLKTVLSTVGRVSRVPVFHIMPNNSAVERAFCSENVLRPYV